MMSTMNEIEAIHLGIFQSLMLEFEQHRLPRLLRLRDKMNNGGAISDLDFEYLCKELRDACVIRHMTVAYPELQEFCLEISHLYKDICDGALENEIH
jgi:hypothetical protein